jgi:hypothetical protein
MENKYLNKTITSKEGLEYTVLKLDPLNRKYTIELSHNKKQYIIGRESIQNNTLKKVLRLENPDKPTYCGVGYSHGKYSIKSPAGRKWTDMIDRCYRESKGTQEKSPTYSICVVCDDWLLLDTFGDWFYGQVGCDLKWQLDKDIIKPDNKIYCPKYCCLVPQEVNLHFRGNTPKITKSGRYQTMVRFRGRYINKTFKAKEDAEAYIKFYKNLGVTDLINKWWGVIPNHILTAMNQYYQSSN